MVKPFFIQKLDILNRNKKLCLALIIVQVLLGFLLTMAIVYFIPFLFINPKFAIIILIFLVMDYQAITIANYNITNYKNVFN